MRQSYDFVIQNCYFEGSLIEASLLDMQTQLSLMNKKNNLLHESFYKEKKKGKYSTVTYAEEYFQKHQLTDLLKDSVKYLLKDGMLPRNPYPCLYRLICINSVEDSLTSYFHLNSISGITLNSKNKKHPIQQIRIGQVSLFSSSELATQVDTKSIGDIQSLVKTNKLTFNVESYIAFCGTQLLKSKLVKYTCPSQNCFVFNNYLHVGGREKGADIFSKSVYNAVQDIINSKQCYFKHLCFESLYGMCQAQQIWNKSDIILYKTKLFNRLCFFPFEGRDVSICYFEKYNGQYVQIKQKFYPIVENGNQFLCTQSVPFTSLFKGGFLTRQGAQFYLTLKHNQSTRATPKELFAHQNSKWTLWYFYQQNFQQFAWNIYFQLISTKNDDHGILYDLISSLLCSPISELCYYIDRLKVIRSLIQFKVDVKEIQNNFGFVSTCIKQNLNQGYNAQLSLMKKYFVKLSHNFLRCEYFQSHKYSKSSQYEVINNLYIMINILQVSVIHYKQVLLGFNESFKKYFQQELIQHQGTFKIKQVSITSFAEFFQMKSKSEVCIVDEQIDKIMKQFKLSSQKAKDVVIVNYYQQNKLKENIYQFLLEICFGAKPLHSLPILINNFIQFVFQFQYNELIINNIQFQDRIEESKTNKTQQALIEDIRIHSFKGNLRYYGYSFLKIEKYMSYFKIEEKAVSVLYSVSGRLLMQNMIFTDLNENTLTLDIDIVINKKQQDALLIFYNLIMNKCRQLQKFRNIGVVGFFNKRFIIRQFDIKNVLSFEQFKSVITCSQSILLKCFVIDNRVKMIELTFNLHYISDGWKHLKLLDPFWLFNRVFFHKKYLELWMDLYPNIQNKYKQNQSQITDINLSMKKWLIQATKQRKVKPYILYYCSEQTYQLGRLAFIFVDMIQYIKMDRTGKIQLKSIKSSIKQHCKKIRRVIKQYSYIYYQGSSLTIFQYLKLIENYISLHSDNNGEENQLIWLQEKYNRVGQLLTSSSEAITLYYRNFLKNIDQLTFVF